MVGPKPPAAMQTPPTWRFLNVLPNWRKQKEVENISVINARLTVTRSNSWHRWGHVSSSPPSSSVHCATQAFVSAVHLYLYFVILQNMLMFHLLVFLSAITPTIPRLPASTTHLPPVWWLLQKCLVPSLPWHSLSAHSVPLPATLVTHPTSDTIQWLSLHETLPQSCFTHFTESFIFISTACWAISLLFPWHFGHILCFVHI